MLRPAGAREEGVMPNRMLRVRRTAGMWAAYLAQAVGR